MARLIEYNDKNLNKETGRIWKLIIVHPRRKDGHERTDRKNGTQKHTQLDLSQFTKLCSCSVLLCSERLLGFCSDL